MDPESLVNKVAMLYDNETGQLLQLDQARRRWRSIELDPGMGGPDGSLYRVSEVIVAREARGLLPAWSGRNFEMHQALANFIIRRGTSRHFLTGDPPEVWVRLVREARRTAAARAAQASRDRSGHHPIGR